MVQVSDSDLMPISNWPVAATSRDHASTLDVWQKFMTTELKWTENEAIEGLYVLFLPI